MARGLIDRALRMGEARQFKDYEKRVESINRIEPEMELLDDEEPGLEVLGDSAYSSGETRAALRAAKHLQTIKPAPLAAAVPRVHHPRLHH